MKKIIVTIHCRPPGPDEEFPEDDTDLIKDGKVMGKIISASRVTGRIKFKIPPWLVDAMREEYGGYVRAPESN